MNTPREQYNCLEEVCSIAVEKCPVCHARPSLWEYVNTHGNASKVVCCTRGEPFGPQMLTVTGLMNEGCLLYMPPDAFYRATRREAVKYWNTYAEALTTLRELAP